jgi:hypothetical protein
MGIDSLVKQFVQILKRYFLLFPKEVPNQVDQNEIIEILDQVKDTEWHEAMVNTNIHF